MPRPLLIILTVAALVPAAHAQTPVRRAASPAGSSVAQIGGVFDPRTGYVNGRWMEIRAAAICSVRPTSSTFSTTARQCGGLAPTNRPV
jgi:hypothetical protein